MRINTERTRCSHSILESGHSSSIGGHESRIGTCPIRSQFERDFVPPSILAQGTGKVDCVKVWFFVPNWNIMTSLTWALTNSGV